MSAPDDLEDQPVDRELLAVPGELAALTGELQEEVRRELDPDVLARRRAHMKRCRGGCSTCDGWLEEGDAP